MSGGVSRRAFLRGAAGLAAGALLPRGQVFTQPPIARALQAELERLAAGHNVTFALRRLAGGYLEEQWRVGVHSGLLRPAASSFKAWVVSYYFALTPPDEWQAAPGARAYSVGVHSHNTRTGELIAEVGARQRFGNAVQKYNDYTRHSLGLDHGMFRWHWPGNPLVGVEDARYAPVEGRQVWANGAWHSYDNATTADDLCRGYTALARLALLEDAPGRQESAAARATLGLLAQPSAPEFRSPIERAAGVRVYMGKDGVLPAANSPAGRVLNDAGVVPWPGGAVVLACLTLGVSEPSVIALLRGVFDALYDLEGVPRPDDAP